MVLIICGHQRSGTTLLRRLCDRHPDMTITMEVGIFIPYNRHYTLYCLRMLRRWLQVRNRPLNSSYTQKSWIRLRNLTFLIRYLFRMSGYWKDKIGLQAIEAGLRGILPPSDIIGDKYPDYVYSLDKLIEIKGLRCLIIYRDCRDVTSSALQMARTKWRNKQFSKKLDTAEKVAKRWVLAIELMERHSDKSYAIRYEDLIQQPERELEGIGSCLNVDSKGFPAHIIRGTSIGKYKIGLTDSELEMVMRVAGPTMARLGYV